MSEPASDPTGGPKDRSAAPPDPAAAGPGRARAATARAPAASPPLAHLPVPRAGRLPRNVVVLGLVSFFQDAASELVYPVLPLFLTSTLGASAATVGIVEGVAEGVAACVKVVSGRLAEVRRRRPFVAAGYGIASLAKLLLAAANGWPLVLAARVLDRFGKGVRTAPRDALIADSVLPPARGAAFGFHRSADTAGAVVGPLLGLALYELLDHQLRPLLAVAFLPAAVSVALVPLVRESRPSARPSDAAPRPRPVWRPPTPLGVRYRHLMLFLTLFAVVNFSDALLILRASQLGLGFAAVIGVYVLYNLVYAALSYPAGTLSDRVPRRWVFAAGLTVFAFVYLGLGVARSGGWVWLLLPVYGAYTALTDGVGKAWVVDVTPAADIATGLGLYQGLTGAGAILAGLWAGLAWGHTGRLPLLVAGAAAAVLAAVLALTGRWLDPPAARTPPDAATRPSPP